MQMETSQVIGLAQKHVRNGALMQSSAQLCLDDAVLLRNNGHLEDAKRRALKSLAYSVGVFHEDYGRASK
jgi:hypothetical protein